MRTKFIIILFAARFLHKVKRISIQLVNNGLKMFRSAKGARKLDTFYLLMCLFYLRPHKRNYSRDDEQFCYSVVKLKYRLRVGFGQCSDVFLINAYTLDQLTIFG